VLIHNRADIEGSRLNVFERFFQAEAAGSVVLMAASAAALAWANSPWAGAYFRFAHVPLAMGISGWNFTLSLQHWVNDLLMTVFFFVVGLEIKRECMVGELATRQRAALPVLAAVGGLVVPAAIYATANAGGPGAAGWGVPMATDIAFALGVLAVFGSRVPTGLKVFLAALAIADDLGAVVVIAVFYTESIRIGALAIAALLLAVSGLTARAGVSRRGFYLVLWLLLWVAVTVSRLHPTIAGVLAAFTVPVSTAGGGKPMGQALEEQLHPVVAFVILPLFAFFNAGVTVDASVARDLVQPVGAGVVLGLVIGKQVGVVAASWLAVASGKATLPDGVSWGQIYGVACLAGIGFTMSLFVTDLAFIDERLAAQAKLATLLSSVTAAVWGAGVLRLTLRKQT
jgi:NhaA family Na+:H+ antiporter